MEMNPYQSPLESASQQVASPPGALNPSMLNQVRIVSILMIIQGAMCGLMGGLLLVAALVIGPIIQADLRQQPRRPGPEPFPREYAPMLLMAVYGAMGAAGLIPGGLLIFAGIRNYAFRSRTFGVVALCLGLASVGTCYCLPTAIALAVYGMIVYTNASVKRGFELVAEGWSPDQVVAAAYQQVPLGPPRKT